MLSEACWRCTPVQVLCGMTHAVDAMIAREGCLHRAFQGLVILQGQAGAAPQLGPHEAHTGLYIHLHSINPTACSHAEHSTPHPQVSLPAVRQPVSTSKEDAGLAVPQTCQPSTCMTQATVA